MKIQLTENYQVELDNQCWAISKRNKAGAWVPFKYPRDLHQAIETVRTLELKRLGSEGVTDALKGIQEVNEALTASLDAFKAEYPQVLWAEAHALLLLERKDMNETVETYFRRKAKGFTYDPSVKRAGRVS